MTDLLFVGRAAGRTLEKFGVRTIGELARFDREALYQLLGGREPSSTTTPTAWTDLRWLRRESTRPQSRWATG